MIIRKAEVKDDKNILKMLKDLDTQTKYMLYEPEERSDNITIIQRMISEAIDGESLFLVALDNEEIVGFLSAQRGALNKIKHSAYIVVGILENYRSEGIGTKFLKGLDLWAIENKIVRLELTVVCKNLVAKNLYEKSGFEIEGIKRRSILIEGKYMDEYYMGKIY